MAVNLVIDTNIILDLWGFVDPVQASLRAELGEQTTWVVDAEVGATEPRRATHPWRIDWIATEAMRDELVSVLSRTHLQAAFVQRGGSASAVTATFAARVRMVAQPPAQSPRDAIRCSDADDQKFIDLALAHQAVLLSKDKAVLKLRRRLSMRGVVATLSWDAAKLLRAV